MLERLIPCLTFLVAVVILLYNISSSYAIRGNELKHLKEELLRLEAHLCKKVDGVMKRVERLENRIFENKE